MTLFSGHAFAGAVGDIASRDGDLSLLDSVKMR